MVEKKLDLSKYAPSAGSPDLASLITQLLRQRQVKFGNKTLDVGGKTIISPDQLVKRGAGNKSYTNKRNRL